MNDNWIKAEDRLPETRKRVIVAFEPYQPGNWWRTVAMYIPAMTVPEQDFMADEYWGDGDYCEEKDQYYTPEGWYEGNVEAETNWKISGVRLWQPFPDLPVSQPNH